MGSDKGSLLEIQLSRKMRLSLLLLIVLVAVSGIHSENNLENESGISKEAVKSVSQDDIAQMDLEKTIDREKREGNKNVKKKWKNSKKNNKGKVNKGGTGNRSGKGKKNSNKKKGSKKGKIGNRKTNTAAKAKMSKSSKT